MRQSRTEPPFPVQVASSSLKGHQAPVLSLDYNYGENRSIGCLLSGSEDGTARVWDLRERLRASLCIKAKSAVISVAFGLPFSSSINRIVDCSSSPFSRDFSVFLSSSNSIWEYDLRNVNSPIVIQENYGPSLLLKSEDEINQIIFRKNSRSINHLLAGVDDTGSLHVWKQQAPSAFRDATTNTTVISPAAHNTVHHLSTKVPNHCLLTTVAFRPHTVKSDQLITGSADACIRLWDAGGGNGANQRGKLKLLDTVNMNHVDNNHTTGNSGNVSGHSICNPPMVHHVSFSPSGRWIASALGDGSIVISKMEARSFGASVRLEDAHRDAVANAVFAPWNNNNHNYIHKSSRMDENDRLLCSCGNDGRVVLWDLGTNLCGRHTPQLLEDDFVDRCTVQANSKSYRSSSMSSSSRSLERNEPFPRSLLAIEHGIKPNWMVSCRAGDPYFPSSLFIADTSNDITSYTIPLTT